MLNIKLKDYQKRAVNELEESTKEFLKFEEKQKLIVFKAPTGSGKTVIAAKYIERVAEISDEDVCFIWISIGKGNLHEQSKNKLNNILKGVPACKLMEDTLLNDVIRQNEVVVVNWEKINRKKDGEWANISMRDGEKTTFPEVIKKTNKQRKIILLIDESHHGTDTKTSEELKTMINPEILINLSATPNYIPTQDKNLEKYIEVTIEEVIKSGIIKREVYINDTIDDELLINSDKNMLELVIDESIKKRELLKKGYEYEKTNINPLCLIQIPNAKNGDIAKEQIEIILKERKISTDIGNLAIWLSDEKINKNEIEELDSKVDYLIFKTAIATGWDCPRAQVLLKLRETKSEVFDIQTIGRILRMPEHKHYSNENLNRAYIYTNSADIKVNVEDLSLMVKYIKTNIRVGFDNVKLPSYYKQSNENMLIIRQKLDTMFEELLFSAIGISVDYNASNNKEILKNEDYNLDMSKVIAKIMNKEVIGSGELDNGFDSLITDNTSQYLLSPNEVNIEFISSLKKVVPRFYESIIPLWHVTFCKLFNLKSKGKGIKTNLQSLYLNNKDKFDAILFRLIELYKEEYRNEVNRDILEEFSIFTIPTPKIRIDDESLEVFIANKYIYDDCVLKKSRSNPEKNFEKLIDNSDSVKWWYKNEDSGKENFGIKYKYKDNVHVFYPDFIVLFKDNSIGIYETKDEKDRDGDTFTKQKAESLQKYIKEENESNNNNLKGGIINSSNSKNIVINDNDRFNPYDGNVSEWKIFRI